MYTHEISVIMPCYNVEQYVEEALNSLFEQTYQDFQIICIDDGSSDNTLSILHEIEKQHENMTVYANTNHGVGYERNFGVKKATGKYIYYMDSDDVLNRNCLQVFSEYIKKTDFDLLLFEADSFYETKDLELKYPQYKTLYHRKDRYNGIFDGETLYVNFRKNDDYIVSTCVQLVKREFLESEKIVFPENIVMEDVKYTFNCLLKAKQVICIPDSLYYRRVRESSIMTRECMNEKIKALSYSIYSFLPMLEMYINKEDVYFTMLNHILALVRQLNQYIDGDIMKLCSNSSFQIEDRKFEGIFSALILLDKMYIRLMDEKKELKIKLQRTYEEKSEINKKLQITYKEKAERGDIIKQQKAKLEDLENKIQKEKEAKFEWKQKYEKAEEELSQRKENFIKKIIKKFS